MGRVRCERDRRATGFTVEEEDSLKSTAGGISKTPESMLSGVGNCVTADRGALTGSRERSDRLSLLLPDTTLSDGVFVIFLEPLDVRFDLILATFALAASAATISSAICLADFSPVFRPRYPTQLGAPHRHSTRAPPSATPNASKL